MGNQEREALQSRVSPLDEKSDSQACRKKSDGDADIAAKDDAARVRRWTKCPTSQSRVETSISGAALATTPCLTATAIQLCSIESEAEGLGESLGETKSPRRSIDARD